MLATPFSTARTAPVPAMAGTTRQAMRMSIRAQAVQLPTEYKTIKPKGQLVLARVPEAQRKTSGGLYLPSSAQKAATTGTVVSVGDGRVDGRTHEFTVCADQTILYSKFGIGVTELEQGSDKFVLIREEDILGVLPRNGTPTSSIASLEPLHDRVLVKVESAAEESLGGVLLPESAKSKPVSGEVVAHGPGKVKKDGTLKPTRVKSGQRVVYFKYAGDSIEAEDGTRYVVLREQDILCTV